MAKKSAESKSDEKRAHPTEVVPIASLKAHLRNYKKHPPAQVEHLCASLRQYGQFRNVVVARDSTILAGHGVVQAMSKLGWTEATVVRLDLDPGSKAALKLVALDNELPKFAETDERGLAELLRDVAGEEGIDLLGTGFDEEALSALISPDESPPGGAGAFVGASLSERFGIPPFSVFNAREGWWQERKAAWLALGIKSELGRGARVVPNGTTRDASQDGCYTRTPRANAVPGGATRPLDQPAYAEQLKRTRNSPGGSPRPAAKIEGGKIRRRDGSCRPLKVDN